MNNARRILLKAPTLLRGCWFWSKKLHFQKNFGRNFIAVEGVRLLPPFMIILRPVRHRKSQKANDTKSSPDFMSYLQIFPVVAFAVVNLRNCWRFRTLLNLKRHIMESRDFKIRRIRGFNIFHFGCCLARPIECECETI